MKRFKERTRIKTLWMSVVGICLPVSYFVLFLNQDKLPKIPSFINGFQAGALFGIELILVHSIFKNLRGMGNDKALKKLYIEENDERRVMIMQKTGAIGMSICILGLGFATVIAGFFNEAVFFSLLGATLFAALVKGIFKIYYHKKL